MASRKEEKERLRAERLRQETEEQEHERRRRLLQYGSAAVFVAVVAIVALIVISQSGGGSGGNASDITDSAAVAKQLQGIPQRGNVLGNASAKVTVVEFGDLQCPVCREFSLAVAPQLIAGSVRHGQADYEFRPWDIIGPQSPAASSAALAAGEQRRFWNYLELFYRNQGEENSGYVTDDFLTAVANGAGVPDIPTWNADREPSKWASTLSKNDSDAKKLGFTGTPSILVEGPGGQKTFASIPDFSQIEAAIKAVQ
jgi:protein-disulfide isomerase